MTRIGILGAEGRMGQLVARLIESEYSEKATIGSRVDRQDTPEDLFSADVVIDFSLPSAMAGVAERALAHNERLPAFVVGSTGWKIDDRKKLEELAKRTPVLMSSNFSTGVLALIEILRQASPFLEKLGYTPIIVDTHHKHKKDAPSGTALSLQRAISPAGPGNVQTHSIRAGEIIGDHEVTFYGTVDHLTIGHFAQDRSIFARGAIDAALWLASRPRESLSGLIGIEAFFKEKTGR